MTAFKGRKSEKIMQELLFHSEAALSPLKQPTDYLRLKIHPLPCKITSNAQNMMKNLKNITI